MSSLSSSPSQFPSECLCLQSPTLRKAGRLLPFYPQTYPSGLRSKVGAGSSRMSSKRIMKCFHSLLNPQVFLPTPLACLRIFPLLAYISSPPDKTCIHVYIPGTTPLIFCRGLSPYTVQASFLEKTCYPGP